MFRITKAHSDLPLLLDTHTFCELQQCFLTLDHQFLSLPRPFTRLKAAAPTVWLAKSRMEQIKQGCLSYTCIHITVNDGES